MNNQTIEIVNSIETMLNEEYIGVEINVVILEFMKDRITGHINGNFLTLFNSGRENLGYLKLHKRNNIWKIIEPTNYPRVRDEDIPENWKGNLKLIDGRRPCITPRTNPCST